MRLAVNDPLLQIFINIWIFKQAKHKLNAQHARYGGVKILHGNAALVQQLFHQTAVFLM